MEGGWQKRTNNLQKKKRLKRKTLSCPKVEKERKESGEGKQNGGLVKERKKEKTKKKESYE